MNGIKKRKFHLIGIGFFISVGYLDPGNWATDISAGSEYGYELIWILIFSSIIANVLQILCINLGVYSKLDLAEACKSQYSRVTNYILWILAELAIIACDLAELLGSAIALNLLFNVPYMVGIIITGLDTLLVLILQDKNFKKLQLIIVSLVFLITASFIYELFLVQPNVADIASGFKPKFTDGQSLLLGIGIIGATVMPHNLYLHSSLVKKEFTDLESKVRVKKLIKDVAFALSIALIVNAAILILSAGTFFENGMHNVTSIEEAYVLLQPLLGTHLAPIVFGIALLLSGQASTITGTMAGQAIMEGFVNIRIKPWQRRLITRLLAIVPAILFVYYYGSSDIDSLLIISQVFLSLQLPFAIIPLIIFNNNQEMMNGFQIKKAINYSSILFTVIIIALNLILIYSTFASYSPAIPVIIIGLMTIFMIYIIIEPKRSKKIKA